MALKTCVRRLEPDRALKITQSIVAFPLVLIADRIKKQITGRIRRELQGSIESGPKFGILAQEIVTYSFAIEHIWPARRGFRGVLQYVKRLFLLTAMLRDLCAEKQEARIVWTAFQGTQRIGLGFINAVKSQKCTGAQIALLWISRIRQ